MFPFFPQECRRDSFFPFSSLILWAPPPTPSLMTSSVHRKDTSCREGLPAPSGIIIISDAKNPDGLADMCNVFQFCGLPTLTAKLLSENVKTMPS